MSMMYVFKGLAQFEFKIQLISIRSILNIDESKVLVCRPAKAAYSMGK
jgi:hypothetical protein